MTRNDLWKLEYARRRAIGQAVFLSPYINSFQDSAQAFILALDEGYQKELSRYIGVEEPHGVLIAMQEPGFLKRKRGIVVRLAAWGWDPFRHDTPPRKGPGRARGRGDIVR